MLGTFYRRSPGFVASRAIVLAALFPVLVAAQVPPAASSPTDRVEEIEAYERTARRLTDHAYSLVHKYRPGEVLRYEVQHQVQVKTTIDGNTQMTRSRSRSVKRWDVREAAPESVTFDHSIESIDMWSETQGKSPVQYNSQTDQEVPPEYQGVAELVGKSLARVTMNRFGQVQSRDNEVQKVDLGVGDIVLPLPEKPVPIGYAWSAPSQVQVRLTDGQYKTIKTQQLYRLEKVASGVATISLQTQVLTPVPDARVQSQLVQKLTRGQVKFDLDAGRVVSKQVDWDENVVGFSGPASSMSYLARLTETLIE